MDLQSINDCLARGDLEHSSLLPRVTRLKTAAFVFEMDFGLAELPIEPGILFIRGARQYGKSTWLEQQIEHTIKKFGAGTAFYLNGEYIFTADKLEMEMDALLASFAKDAAVRRIFIDEITAVENWNIVLKRMADRGKLEGVLVVTTGSSAMDLRRGTEKMPGRKGKLDRTDYIFTPISFAEFKRVCGKKVKKNLLLTYLLTGGSPVACSELASQGRLPEYVVDLTRDWVDGELAKTGRSRSSLFSVMNVLFSKATTPIGQSKLAREVGLANNTVAQGYIECLNDLGCVIPAFPWDQHRNVLLKRKESKYHFTNLLVAVAYHPSKIRSVAEFLALPETEQGNWYEWLVAQELVRRNSIQGEHILEPLAFWQNKDHEIDFVMPGKEYIEVKRGQSSVLEFSWFPKQFPNKHLTVISKNKFATDSVKSCLIENFLLG